MSDSQEAPAGVYITCGETMIKIISNPKFKFSKSNETHVYPYNDYLLLRTVDDKLFIAFLSNRESGKLNDLISLLPKYFNNINFIKIKNHFLPKCCDHFFEYRFKTLIEEKRIKWPLIENNNIFDNLVILPYYEALLVCKSAFELNPNYDMLRTMESFYILQSYINDLNRFKNNIEIDEKVKTSLDIFNAPIEFFTKAE